MLDIARGSAWPARDTGRTLRNAFLEEWRDRADELAGDGAAQESYKRASARGDMDAVAVWAGEAIDLITETQAAGEIVAAMVARAEEAIRGIVRD